MKKNKRKITRKKANVIVLGLFTLVGIFFLTLVFLNIIVSAGTVQRIMYATQEGAKLRATAVDIRLKEQEGLVEMFHGPYERNANLDIEHDSITRQEGHKEIYPPGTNEYDEKVEYANQIAIKGAIDTVNTYFGKNIEGEQMTNAKEDNFCLDIQPIPEDAGEIIFHCSTTAGNDDFDFTYKYVMTRADAHKFKELKVKNAVMFATSIEYTHFFQKYLLDFGLLEKPKFAHYEIAFPEVDVCTRAANEDNPFDLPEVCSSALKGYDLN